MTLPVDNLPSSGSLLRIARALLARYGLELKKHLGQNLLIDPQVLRAIVTAAELSAEDTVIEVGPGLGFLTRELARRAGRVIAVELDARFVAVLKETLTGFPNLTVIHGDILKLEPAELLSREGAGPTYKVVANLPYYITSPVLRHFLEASVKPQLIVVMVQKEVAQRLAARPPNMSLLSVSVQIYGRPSIVCFVPSRAFFPPPEVNSAVVRIDVYDRPAVNVDDLNRFMEFVTAGFSQPRKQIHNNLAQRLGISAEQARALLQRAGIDPRRRAETLTLAEWERIYWEWRNMEMGYGDAG